MSTPSDERSSRYSRKRFLGRLGVGAAAAGAGGLLHAKGAAGAAYRERVHATSAGHFGRIFNGIPSFTSRHRRAEEALRDIGKPGGILDAKDALDKGPVLLITDPALSANNPNNPAQTAGATFVGQFLDHDMTFDVGSRLGRGGTDAGADARPLRPLDPRSRRRDLLLRLRRLLGSRCGAGGTARRTRPHPRRRGGLVRKGAAMKSKWAVLVGVMGLAVYAGNVPAETPAESNREES